MYQLWHIVESQFWERWHTTTQIEDLDADLDSFEFENAEDVDLYMSYLATLGELHDLAEHLIRILTYHFS